MKIRKDQYVRVLEDDRIPVRYYGRTGLVLKKSRTGICEVKFPDAHRVTPLNVPLSALEAF